MRLVRISIVLILVLSAGAAHARNDHLLLPIAEALATPAAKERLNPRIKLIFGKRPAGAKSIGRWSTSKKTNSFGKSDKTACEWAFLSAMITLQARAEKEGGNAVVGIESVYKRIVTTSETEYMCGAGAMVAGVSFGGEVVNLAP